MKLLKSVVSVLTASLMCCAFSGSAYIEAAESEIDISSKLSQRLMEEYGVNEEILKTSEGLRHVGSRIKGKCYYRKEGAWQGIHVKLISGRLSNF